VLGICDSRINPAVRQRHALSAEQPQVNPGFPRIFRRCSTFVDRWSVKCRLLSVAGRRSKGSSLGPCSRAWNNSLSGGLEAGPRAFPGGPRRGAAGLQLQPVARGPRPGELPPQQASASGCQRLAAFTRHRHRRAPGGGSRQPNLGMLGRVCVPLLVRGFRVGYLWVQQDRWSKVRRRSSPSCPAVVTSWTCFRLLLDSNTAESEFRRGANGSSWPPAAGNPTPWPPWRAGRKSRAAGRGNW
jgi:hypothetical protein